MVFTIKLNRFAKIIRMVLSAVVVTDLKNGIGKNNQLLCHLPADLKFFKSTTMGAPILMGRKTYESIGRLLPGRKNIVITRKADYRIEGAEIYHSLDAAIESCNEEKIFIIGGAEIFNQAMPRLDEIYRTLIKHTFEADTFFPDLKNSAFKMEWEECHEKDEKNHYDYCFQKWVR
jgi:dihydrofolate reductase